MRQKTIDKFIQKAQALDHPLLEKNVAPCRLVNIGQDTHGNAIVISSKPISDLPQRSLSKGQRLCIDFGDHYVGYITLKFTHFGSPQDAPAFLRLKFAEIPQEILDDSSDYKGWISKGWIQEEFIHIDELPWEWKLPRRYAFRYLEVMVIDTSRKFQIGIGNVSLKAVSAVSLDNVKSVPGLPADLQEIDHISLKTLQDCMQHVFEDGPKRDRRLWIGDLRLQARVNYVTFRNYDLVKRCMYLFAGLTREDGKIGACLFTSPVMQVDDTFFWDYSLFFVSILYDYYMQTGDMAVLEELWPSACRQIELAVDEMENGILKMTRPMTAFIDWKEGLERQASAHGIWVYILRQAKQLAQILGERNKELRLDALLADGMEKAISCFWDEREGFFVSGDKRQISWISQAWMVLADVFDKEKSRTIMRNLLKTNPHMGTATPYAYHHIVEALLHVGEKEKALELIGNYWGNMAKLGADTFWETFDPDKPVFSPYGNQQINSFCHAWSCTPSWFFRKIYSL